MVEAKKTMFEKIFEDGTLDKMTTNLGKPINGFGEAPIMIVFLRQFNCIFCREALTEIAKERNRIEALGTKIVFVHMSDNQTAEKYFAEYNLPNPIHVSDPEQVFYKAFGLLKGNFQQLFGLQTWVRGFKVGVEKGILPKKQLGDGLQMPGVFLLHENAIKEHFIHQKISSRPDYFKMIQCCVN